MSGGLSTQTIILPRAKVPCERFFLQKTNSAFDRIRRKSSEGSLRITGTRIATLLGHASIDPVRRQSELVLRRSLEQTRTLTDAEDFAAAVAKGLLRGSEDCETTDSLGRASRSDAVSVS
jgi:hypothetical protein